MLEVTAVREQLERATASTSKRARGDQGDMKHEEEELKSSEKQKASATRAVSLESVFWIYPSLWLFFFIGP